MEKSFLKPECKVFSVQPLKESFYLGVGPFGVVAVLGGVRPALLRAFGVEGVRGATRGLVVKELLGVRGASPGWGMEGALVVPDTGV